MIDIKRTAALGESRSAEMREKNKPIARMNARMRSARDSEADQIGLLAVDNDALNRKIRDLIRDFIVVSLAFGMRAKGLAAGRLKRQIAIGLLGHWRSS